MINTTLKQYQRQEPFFQPSKKFFFFPAVFFCFLFMFFSFLCCFFFFCLVTIPLFHGFDTKMEGGRMANFINHNTTDFFQWEGASSDLHSNIYT